MSNDELWKNDESADKMVEEIVDRATEGADDGTERRKRSRKERRKKRTKETVMVYAMIFLMIIGAISILYVPYLHYQNDVLRTDLEYYEETEISDETFQLIKEFSNYIDSVDVSNGMSWDVLIDFEETVLEYELVSTVSQLEDSIQTEQRIISKLEEAYQNTDDKDMQEILQAAIDSHKIFLSEKENDLAEYKEFVSQYLEMKKILEEELKKENKPIDAI